MGGRIAGTTAVLLMLALAVSGCAAPGADTGDRSLVLRLVNGGPIPLRCRIFFGHWVDRDLGALAAGGTVDIDMKQSAKDGALYIPRDDGRRLMMVENIACGRQGVWMASFGQVDLAPIRTMRASRVTAACNGSDHSARVTCDVTDVAE